MTMLVAQRTDGLSWCRFDQYAQNQVIGYRAIWLYKNVQILTLATLRA